MHAVLTRSLSAWIDHRAGSKGAALAFYALFSMTPILILAIAAGGYFYGAEATQGEIVAQVEELVGRNGAQAIQALKDLARTACMRLDQRARRNRRSTLRFATINEVFIAFCLEFRAGGFA